MSCAPAQQKWAWCLAKHVTRAPVRSFTGSFQELEARGIHTITVGVNRRHCFLYKINRLFFPGNPLCLQRRLMHHRAGGIPNDCCKQQSLSNGKQEEITKLYQQTVELSNRSLNPGLHLTEGFSVSLPFFSHLWTWLCQSLSTLHILLSFFPPLLGCSQFTSAQPFQATWTSAYRSVTHRLVSLILIFSFTQEDLPALTRRQITNFRSQAWVHPHYCSSSPLMHFPPVLLPRQNHASQLSSIRVLRQPDIAVRGKDKMWFARGYTATELMKLSSFPLSSLFQSQLPPSTYSKWRRAWPPGNRLIPYATLTPSLIDPGLLKRKGLFLKKAGVLSCN